MNLIRTSLILRMAVNITYHLGGVDVGPRENEETRRTVRRPDRTWSLPEKPGEGVPTEVRRRETRT